MSDKQSHRDKILGALLNKERLSKLEMLRRFGCWNSGNIILLLRKDGYEIETEMVTKNDKTFAEYFLK